MSSKQARYVCPIDRYVTWAEREAKWLSMLIDHADAQGRVWIWLTPHPTHPRQAPDLIINLNKISEVS